MIRITAHYRRPVARPIRLTGGDVRVGKNWPPIVRDRGTCRWWIALVIAVILCLGAVAAQAVRPWERFDTAETVLGSGSEVTHLGVTYRLLRLDNATEFATDREPRRAIPGARLVAVVIEQRAVAPDSAWDFCSLSLGFDDLQWKDRPEGYNEPEGMPKDSTCATKDDVPADGEPFRFGEVFMIPERYAESAVVRVTRADGVIVLHR